MAFNPHYPSNAAGGNQNNNPIPRAKPSAPTKRAAQGGYDYIQYCPAWTDPDWQDEGPEREKSVFNIQDKVFDRLRPALLPRDQFRQPSIYAHRFSIFPGRTDGRSRTSPTRTDSRHLFPANAEVKTGKQLFGRFEELAQQAGEHVDDYMERTRPDLQKLDETEQQYMQQYEDLLVDENWQSILFGSLTMDQVQAEGYLTMSNNEESELSGPIYPLFARERWVDPRDLGYEEDEPRYMYTLDGQREEWDPRNNDRVWNAMQPAIQLATRILMMDDSFIRNLQDVTNRLWVDSSLFINQPDQTRWRKLKFVRDLNPMDPTRVFGTKELRDSGVNVFTANWEAVCQIFEIKLASGFDFDGKSKRHIMGRQRGPFFFYPGDTITIEIDAELVWPLIVDKYSKSEKLMSSLILATTMAHEMMHAFNSIPWKWLDDPDSVGITDMRQQHACSTVEAELVDTVHNDRFEEPLFENDVSPEVGHAFETHVMGGGYWPWAQSIMSIKQNPPLMQTAGGLIAHITHPEGGDNEAPNLVAPLIRNMRIRHFVRFEDIKKYYTQAFWDVSIHKYGSAALREPSKKPHKISYYPNDVSVLTWSLEKFKKLHLGTDDDKNWLWQYVCDLRDHSHLLQSYVNNLITEACQFDTMNIRFQEDQPAWNDRDKVWRVLGNEALMILCEFSAFFVQVHVPSLDEPVLQFLYGTWENAWYQLGGYPDYQSSLLADVLGDGGRGDWLAQVKTVTINEYERRLLPRLVDFMHHVERELAHMESMICELYQLGSMYWTLYFHLAPGHVDAWRKRVDGMLTTVSNMVAVMEFADQGIKQLEGEWHQRALNLGQRVEDITRLLRLDVNAYEHNWRDLLMAIPMLRKSNRKPHQRFYFLAKKEMMSLTGQQLQDLQEFKQRFQSILNLGGYKVVLPGMDPDELGIAQRLAGTLDDAEGDTARDREIKGPSTGIFDLAGVRELATRLTQVTKDAEEETVNRLKNTLSSDIPTLQTDAAAQASEPPRIPPKFQQMGMRNQPLPLSVGQSFNISGSPFASYYSGTSSPFPAHQPGQPSAWKANTAADMAAWVNGRLGDAPAAPHGIMPHPYAIRETVTEDLQNTSGLSLPMRNPATFANEFPRELVEGYGTRLGTDPLGDNGQSWQQQSQPGRVSPPAIVPSQPLTPGQQPPYQILTYRPGHNGFMDNFSAFGNRATAVSDFDHSNSDTEISEIEDQMKRDGSDTTLVGSSDTEDEESSSGSSDLLFPQKVGGREKKQSLKRKSSWAPVHTKKQKVDVLEDKQGEGYLKPSSHKKKAKSTRKEKTRPWTWKKIIASFGQPSA
ncbi:hypothetical protein ACHAPA_008361 [Fusarium lateritium]